jgi:ribosomal 30S subunit maturation factor RimM
MNIRSKNLQAEKLEIIKMLLNTNNRELLGEIKNLLQNGENDWWYEMRGIQQVVIQEGIEQADQNQTVPHEEAVKIFGKQGLK